MDNISILYIQMHVMVPAVLMLSVVTMAWIMNVSVTMDSLEMERAVKVRTHSFECVLLFCDCIRLTSNPPPILHS